MKIAALEKLNSQTLDRIAIEQDRKRLFVLYSDLKDTASKPWLVHQMLGQGEASTFYGAPGCGKGVIIEDSVCSGAELKTMSDDEAAPQAPATARVRTGLTGGQAAPGPSHAAGRDSSSP